MGLAQIAGAGIAPDHHDVRIGLSLEDAEARGDGRAGGPTDEIALRASRRAVASAVSVETSTTSSGTDGS